MINKDLLLNALETLAQYGIPDPRAAHLLDIGSGPYLQYFEREILDDLIVQGGATCRFYEGAYGAGKSHLLSLLRGIAIRRGMAVANIDLSLALRLEDWRSITMTILNSIEIDIEGQIIRSLPNILRALKSSGKLHYDQLSRTTLQHSGFQKAILYAVESEHLTEEAWRLLSLFLTGNKVTVTELKKHGLLGVKNPLTQRNAELVLKTVLVSLYHLGIQGVMIQFDENEKTLTHMHNSPSKKQRIAANLIRRLIDGCTTGMLVGTVVIFAILPDFLDTCSAAYPALGQRLQLVRNGLQRAAWRVPVLPVSLINELREQQDFVNETVRTFVEHAKTLEIYSNGLEELLRESGDKVIKNNVGSGYKRELMKVISSDLLLYAEGVKA